MRRLALGLGGWAIVAALVACGSSSEDSKFDPGGGGGTREVDGSTPPSFGDQPDGGGGPPAGCVGLECQQVSCPNGGTTSLSGKVYAPEGTVPLYNAIVYVPNAPLDPFPNGVQCDQCGKVSGRPIVSTLTNEKGEFHLDNVPAGSDIPVVIQIGKWRRKITIPAVAPCTDTPMQAADTRLPRTQAEGDMPKIAITSGTADSLECFLRKIGIADSEFSAPGGTGAVTFYKGNGSQITGGSAVGTDLWGNPTELRKHDIVVLSCEGSENTGNKAPYYGNILDYLNSGGKVFSSHYHYVWFRYGPNPLPTTANWTPTGGTSPFSIDTSFPKGNAFADWLVNVNATPTRGQIDLTQVRASVGAYTPATSKQWIYSPATQSSKYLSFNAPIGTPPDQQCGRAVFSDVHVSGNGSTQAFPGWCQTSNSGPLTAQEKALLFLFFDLSACVQDESKAPRPPPPPPPR
jgi:hypothetical protein